METLGRNSTRSARAGPTLAQGQSTTTTPSAVSSTLSARMSPWTSALPSTLRCHSASSAGSGAGVVWHEPLGQRLTRSLEVPPPVKLLVEPRPHGGRVDWCRRQLSSEIVDCEQHPVEFLGHPRHARCPTIDVLDD